MINKKVNFKIEARIVLQLGMTLIPDELTALLEIIKNSYDADSTYVDIVINSMKETEHGVGFISIKDNGNGMTPYILEEAFMKLATSFKQHVKISPVFERRALGNKGIGRLSTQRLGKNLKVITIPDVERLKLIESFWICDINDPTILERKFVLDMNWNSLDSTKDITEFSGTLTSHKMDESDSPGTLILIEGLNNISNWSIDQWKINRIKSEIFSMTNIFSSINRDLFHFEMMINEKKITNESIDEKVLEVSCDAFVKYKFTDWKLQIAVYRNRRYLNRRYSEFISDMKKKGFTLINDLSLDFNSYHKKYLSSECTIELLNDQNKNTTMAKFSLDPILKIEELSPESYLAYPGSFVGAIYAIDKSPSAITELSDQLYALELYKKGIRLKKEIMDIWSRAQGYYVFKNNFRILPYGKKDWAGFDSLAMHSKSNIFKSQNISGYISIDGLDSDNLKEQTNRSGLVLDNYGKNLITLIEEYIVNIIAEEDSKFRRSTQLSVKQDSEDKVSSHYGDFVFEKNITTSVKKSVDNSVSNLLTQVTKAAKKVDTSSTDISLNNAESTVSATMKSIELAANELAQVTKQFENSLMQDKSILENELSQIRSIYPLAAQGLIVESLSHELAITGNDIRAISNNAIRDLNNRIYFEDDHRVVIHHTALHNQILHRLEYFRKVIDHISPMTKENLKIQEVFDVKEFLINHYSIQNPMYQEIFKNNIEFYILGDAFKINGVKGYLVTIIDNLILNSVYWLKKVIVKEKCITITILDTGHIYFSDTGFGFDSEIIDTVFEPFVTLREGGRGLGLYICKEMMDLMNGRISLDLLNRNTSDRVNTIILQFEVVKSL